MAGEVQCTNPDSSGGLEELYTDFDAWITKRSWKFRQRKNRSTNGRSPESEVPCRENEPKTIIVDFQECLVNGFSDGKEINSLCPKDLKGLLTFSENEEEFVSYDFVLVRLIRENGMRRILFLNRSKL